MNAESIQHRLAALAPLKDADGQPLLAAVLSAYGDTCRKGLNGMRQALADEDFSTLKRRLTISAVPRRLWVCRRYSTNASNYRRRLISESSSFVPTA